MARLAIFVNDASYAQGFLQPLLADSERASSVTVVMCPPKLSHRIGKWLSNQQRQQWQRSWTARLRQDLSSMLPSETGQQIEWVTAGTRPADTTTELRGKLGTALNVMDIRKPHAVHPLSSIEPGATPSPSSRWKAPVAVSSSLSMVLALVD